jgi:hypothetical protein
MVCAPMPTTLSEALPAVAPPPPADDGIAALRERVAEMDAHRHEWRSRYYRLAEATRQLVAAADAVLARPVADAGCVVPLTTREELQGAVAWAREVSEGAGEEGGAR